MFGKPDPKAIVGKMMATLNADLTSIEQDFSRLLEEARPLLKTRIAELHAEGAWDEAQKQSFLGEYAFNKLFWGRGAPSSPKLDAFLAKHKDKPAFLACFREFYEVSMPSDRNSITSDNVVEQFKAKQTELLEHYVKQFFVLAFDDLSDKVRGTVYRELSRDLHPDRNSSLGQRCGTLGLERDILSKALNEMHKGYTPLEQMGYFGLFVMNPGSYQDDEKLRFIARTMARHPAYYKHHEYSEPLNTIISLLAAMITIAQRVLAIAIRLPYNVASRCVAWVEQTLLSFFADYKAILRREKQKMYVRTLRATGTEFTGEILMRFHDLSDEAFEAALADAEDAYWDNWFAIYDENPENFEFQFEKGVIQGQLLPALQRLQALMTMYQRAMAFPEHFSQQSAAERFFCYCWMALKFLTIALVVVTLSLPLIVADALFATLMNYVVIPLLQAIKLLTCYILAAPLYLMDGASYVWGALFGEAEAAEPTHTASTKADAERGGATCGMGMFDGASHEPVTEEDDPKTCSGLYGID